MNHSNRTLALALASLLPILGCGDSGSSPRRYQVESGVIEYKVEGMLSGTETIYFDQYGAREAKVSENTLSVAGITKKNHQLLITEGGWIYNIDLTNDTGTKMKNEIAENILNSMEGRDPEEVGEAMMAAMGARKVGAEDVAGRTCDVWEMPGGVGKTWVWNSIPLKTEVKMGAQALTTVATRVDLDVSIEDDRFLVPDNVELRDVSGLLKGALAR